MKTEPLEGTYQGGKLRAAGVLLVWFLLSTASPSVAQTFPGEQFSDLISIRELSPDSVLVVDQRERQLYLLGWGSGSARSVLREGEGPLEFRGPGPLFPLSNSQTLFQDAYDGDWVILDWAIGILGLRPEGANLLSVLGSDGDDSLLLSNTKLGVVDSITLMVANQQGETGPPLLTYLGHRRGGPWIFQSDGSRPPVAAYYSPLSSHPQAVMLEAGWIAVAEPQPYQVRWRAPSGEWSTSAGLDELPRVTREMRCQAISRIIQEGPCDAGRITDWPEVLPAFVPSSADGPGPVILSTGKDEVVIRRTNLDRRYNHYDVIGRGTTDVRRLRLPSDSFILGFGDSGVYIVEIGELGLQTLVRLTHSEFTSRFGK